MATFNQVTLIGHVGKEAPQLKVTSESTSYTRFSLAVDQGKDSEPLWIIVVCWGDLAELATKLLFKGAALFVQGRLQVRKYKDKNKMERTAVEVVAATFQLLDKRRAEPNGDSIPEEILPGA